MFQHTPTSSREIISNIQSDHAGSKLAPLNWLGFLQNKLKDEGFYQKVVRAHALHSFDAKFKNPYYNFTPPEDADYVNIQIFSITQLLYHIQTLKTNECIVKVLKIDSEKRMKYTICVFIVELDSDCTSKTITIDTKMSNLRQKQFTDRTVNYMLKVYEAVRTYQKKWLKEKYEGK